MDPVAIKVAIGEALENPSVAVIGLVGRWGVGKTYLWKSVIEERKGQLSQQHPRYAYVSLFGLRSISDVRTSILVELSSMAEAGTQRGSVPRRAWTLAKKTLLTRGARAADALGQAAQEAVQLGIDAFEFSRVRNSLICLDDLERMASDLDAIEVMGLIETLSRERGCKVVLIYSRDNLRDNSKESLSQYREKIFDTEIFLDPPIRYGVEIVGRGQTAETLESLSTIAESLGTKNLRVLRKIIVGFEDVLSHVSDLYPIVKQSLMSSLGVLYYCHLVRAEDVPSIDDVLRIEYVSQIEETDSDNAAVPARYLQFLRRVGWTHLSETDRQLAAYVRDGLCDWEALRTALTAENQEVAASLRREEIDKLWREYRASFRDEAGWKAFATQLYETHLEHVQVVHTRGLDNALWLLRKVGMQNEANDLLEAWRGVHAGRRSMFDLSELETFEKIKDPNLRQVCEAAHIPSEDTQRDIIEVLSRIALEKSWGGDDTAFLESAAIEEYVAAFRAQSLTEPAVRGAKMFLRLGNPGPADFVIRDKISSALKVVAQDSELNKEKVVALGIQP